jgi:hypothetical protein
MSNKPKNFKISAEEVRYNKLVDSIEDMPVFDGRGKGVDVYRCDNCKQEQYTYYRDKGVTPYLIRCDKCWNIAKHCTTLSDTSSVEHKQLKAWVRPTWEQLQRLDKDLRNHVMQGGLVLEEDIR